ncbi:hypothetical protein K493DRAFT_299730 [Basidiobolus meristosporus CBS 931.73]|uniref:Glycosyl hydrolase family 101 n=1 Tax=Basidiobolus meristosporus CBS 931.73 TaxID=1314790 RepID=A0A1Y1YLA9_9FUNG|nr:hypothetical protein K493DRAFT_299730 [Basidiobolus meristosporus CBS 931.73]|eukprot:ORX98789.1 hypothetical protein K493DRAFT_299730 [Basidiobolus meristosporus CBS 931.73]
MTGSRYIQLFLTVLSISSVTIAASADDAGRKFKLSNDLWHITIDPSTLAMEAETAGKNGKIITLSLPMANLTENIQKLSVGRHHAKWRWENSPVSISASLSGDDFHVRVSRTSPGTMQWPLLPLSEQRGAKALLFPKVEGMYIPLDDQEWRAQLTGEKISVTEEMSLPLFGVEYIHPAKNSTTERKDTLSVIFPNPFNTVVEFIDEPMRLTGHHTFSKLSYKQPYELLYHLTPNKLDPIAPSKRFRRLIKSRGQFKSLWEKLHRIGWSQTGHKLIGASHSYLWGKQMLAPQDVKNWAKFSEILSNSTEPLAEALRSKLSLESKEALASKDLPTERFTQAVVTNDINEIVPQLDATQLESPELKYLEDKQKHALKELFQDSVIPMERWGDGASTKMMERLHESGLTRMFLGLPDYQAGFYHPEGVQAANDAGYLIGPYDSYNTAIPDGTDQSFRTANMGQEVFEKCGVMLENGKRLPGFQGKGVYTNTPCVQNVYHRRVREIQTQTRNAYNSWFLDADASGMVHEDYDPAHISTESQDAADRNRRMQWVAMDPRLRLLAGSENGYAHVNREVPFAHGMQNTNFGWGDVEMHKNKSSPYFLGGYFPENQPALFFKPAAIKPIYRELFYNPAKRVPLFQAVFHDSIVTTNHWLIDNLKFPEIQSDVELMQMLYNIPPMVHLNLATAEVRTKYLLRLDAFFRPVHEKLAFKSMTDFAWLSEDRRVQRTTFEDGTQLVANFGDHAYTHGGNLQGNAKCGMCVEAHSIMAKFPDGKVLRYQSDRAVTEI